MTDYHFKFPWFLSVLLAASKIITDPFRLRRSVPLAAGAAVAPSAAAAAVPSGRHAALAVLEKPVASREVGGAIEGDG